MKENDNMAFKEVEKKQQGLGGDKVGGKFFFYGFI